MSRFNVLFYVPGHTDCVGIHHKLVNHLAAKMSGVADVCIVVSDQKGTTPRPEDFDLIHFFGCWSNSACQLADKAYKQHTPYIITPLGALQPWEYAKHQHTLLFNRQRHLTERASAIHVCGKLEMETFSKLGWNKRISLIKNPVLTSLTSFDEMATLTTALYRKVLDSNAQLILKPETQQMIGRLLQAGADPASMDEAQLATLSEQLGRLTDEEWRRSWIYANDEHCNDIINEALTRLQIEKPEVEVSELERFTSKKKAYNEGPLKNDALLSRNILLKNKVKEVFDKRGKTEQQVCLQILNLQYELSHHTAPLLHLVDLFRTMRFTDMDEDLVNDMTHELGIDDFCGRLMAVMQQFLGLTEGFMPFKIKEDKQKGHLLKALTKFETYQ